MARFRRYRKYSRRGRGKWSSNIQEIETQSYVASPSTISADSITLVTNPVQTPIGVSQIYTVKNIECAFTFQSAFAANVTELEDLAVYIMYVPQGMNLTTNYNTEHPEYIMAYKYLGSPAAEGTGTTANIGQQYQPVKIRTRLARKLNTGDQIILFWKIKSTSDNAMPYELGGLVRWWTKAN